MIKNINRYGILSQSTFPLYSMQLVCIGLSNHSLNLLCGSLIRSKRIPKDNIAINNKTNGIEDLNPNFLKRFFTITYAIVTEL